MTIADSRSRFIVYVDESGDHGPVSKENPIFVLAFCIFDKMEYANTVTSYMHRFKFKHFGHDTVVLHEREVRKALAPFAFLKVAERCTEFMGDLAFLIRESKFTVVAAAIRKDVLATTYEAPRNPYHLALEFGLERIRMHREGLGDRGRLHIVFEARGAKEDADLRQEFERVRGTDEVEALFVHKNANHCGVQIADLIARPIAMHVLRPDQRNRAYADIEPKLRRSPDGKVEGWGLKCFP